MIKKQILIILLLIKITKYMENVSPTDDYHTSITYVKWATHPNLTNNRPIESAASRIRSQFADKNIVNAKGLRKIKKQIGYKKQNTIFGKNCLPSYYTFGAIFIGSCQFSRIWIKTILFSPFAFHIIDWLADRAYLFIHLQIWSNNSQHLTG